MGNTMLERQYVRDLAQATEELFQKGAMTPDADDIAEQHYQGRSYGPATVEDVRKKLIRIRDILAEDYDRPVCLVSSVFYTKFRYSPPVSVVDARSALPFGNGKRAEGIHLQDGTEDFIWQAAERQIMAMAAGKMRSTTDRTLASYGKGQLTEATAESMLKGGFKAAMAVTNQATLNELLARPDLELEAGTADDGEGSD